MNRLNVNARFVATVPLAAAFWVVLGCEMTERKFVSGANIAGAPAALPEAGVDPAPEVESLPLCPTGSACKDTGCRDDRQCPEPTHCDPDMQRCIGCLSNADCSNESSLCRTSDGVCVECLTNSECANDFGASRCGADGKCTPAQTTTIALSWGTGSTLACFSQAATIAASSASTTNIAPMVRSVARTMVVQLTSASSARAMPTVPIQRRRAAKRTNASPVRLTLTATA